MKWQLAFAILSFETKIRKILPNRDLVVLSCSILNIHAIIFIYIAFMFLNASSVPPTVGKDFHCYKPNAAKLTPFRDCCILVTLWLCCVVLLITRSNLLVASCLLCCYN